MDSDSKLRFEIDNASFLKNGLMVNSTEEIENIPFKIEFDETKFKNKTSYAEFRVKTQTYFKQSVELKASS